MPTPRRQGRRAFRGIVIMAVLAALALAIFFLDRMSALFNRTYTVVAVASQAPDVRAGTPVWVAGVPAGTVRRVKLLPPRDTAARVALDLELMRAVAPQVRRDSHARFGHSRMVGQTVVEVMPGTARARQLVEHDTLPPIPPRPSAPDVSARARAVRLALDSVMADATGLRQKLARRAPALRAAAREVARARRDLSELQRAYRGGSLAQLMSIQRPNGPLAGMGQQLAGVRRVMAESAPRRAVFQRRLAPERQELQTHMRALQADLAELRRLTSRSVGSLGRMQGDSAVERALAGARASLDSLVIESKKHPLRYVF